MPKNLFGPRDEPDNYDQTDQHKSAANDRLARNTVGAEKENQGDRAGARARLRLPLKPA